MTPCSVLSVFFFSFSFFGYEGAWPAQVGFLYLGVWSLPFMLPLIWRLLIIQPSLTLLCVCCCLLSVCSTDCTQLGDLGFLFPRVCIANNSLSQVLPPFLSVSVSVPFVFCPLVNLSFGVVYSTPFVRLVTLFPLFDQTQDVSWSLVGWISLGSNMYLEISDHFQPMIV